MRSFLNSAKSLSPTEMGLEKVWTAPPLSTRDGEVRVYTHSSVFNKLKRE